MILAGPRGLDVLEQGSEEELDASLLTCDAWACSGGKGRGRGRRSMSCLLRA